MVCCTGISEGRPKSVSCSSCLMDASSCFGVSVGGKGGMANVGLGGKGMVVLEVGSLCLSFGTEGCVGA